MGNKHPRVLIVGTIPYNPNTSSRAFDAYFHGWEKENLRQIFSNTKTPIKGHCESLFQITDLMLLKRYLHRTKDVGVIYNYDELPEEWIDAGNLEVGSKFTEKLYKLGSKESSFKHLARKILWKKKLWNTEKLRNWLDEFMPECVFLAFSDDFFILEIAMFVADRYGIPIMCCIGDDYYFNDKKSISLLYHIYRKKYKACVDRIFSHKSSAIYISDKIRDKYNKAFGIKGDTVYLASNIERHEFRPIDVDNLKISYCGNIRLGRNSSLVDIGNALQQINPTYKVDVYSAEKNEKFIKVLRKCPGIRYHGIVPYSEVMRITSESDISIIVEGFAPEDVTITKYSLSTKVADAISSGCQILSYGSEECGVIGYMISVGCSVVCICPIHLQKQLSEKYILL
jgi:glycosyltransferase involved in cell wall biosynthesis